MAQVIFNNRINMVATAATPSSDGYTIGYDIDGVLKQKDYLGVVTPLFSSSSQNLIQTGSQCVQDAQLQLLRLSLLVRNQRLPHA